MVIESSHLRTRIIENGRIVGVKNKPLQLEDIVEVARKAVIGTAIAVAVYFPMKSLGTYITDPVERILEPACKYVQACTPKNSYNRK